MICAVSMLTKRTDGLNPLVNQVNSLLEKALRSEAHINIINIINIEAINEYHLNGNGLHLNRKGDVRNFINYIKNKPNF